MDAQFKDKFIRLWGRYFNRAELPITFYYSDVEGRAEKVKPGSVDRCIIGALNRIRKGESLAFDSDAIGCPGGKRYSGFTDKLAPNFEYFLSCGIPGKMEGERYKKSPEIVRELLKNWPAFKAPAAMTARPTGPMLNLDYAIRIGRGRTYYFPKISGRFLILYSR